MPPGKLAGLVPASVICVKIDVYRNGRCLRTVAFTFDTIRIGRLNTNDVILDGNDIARLHAVIQRGLDGDGFTISAHDRIRLNGMLISRAKLRQGDRLEVGSFELIVRSEQAFTEAEVHSINWGDPMLLLAKKKAV